MVNQFADIDPIFLIRPDETEQTLLQTYGLTHFDYGECLAYLLIFFMAFFALTWMTLSIKKYSSR